MDFIDVPRGSKYLRSCPKVQKNGGVWSADFPTLSSGCQNLDGARIGIWETAHYEGGIRYRSRYVDGLQQGLHEGFHLNGRRSWVGFYEDDRPIGSHFFFDQQGRQIDVSVIDQSGTGDWRRWSHLGKTAASGRFESGFKTGLWREFRHNGALAKKQSSFRTQHGRTKEYYETGELSLEATYTNGSREGTLTYFYTNGRPGLVAQFHQGRLHGPWLDISSTLNPKKRASIRRDAVLVNGRSSIQMARS